MSSTNKTLTIELSQYVGTDKPTYLTDYNGDMLKIDNAIAADRDSIATAQSKADGADAKADTNAGAISTLDNQINNASNGVAKRVTDVEGDVNTIESLIGNGTPTTSDKTLIGAINELDTIKLDISALTASVVPVSPITGMSATNVQAALAELKAEDNRVNTLGSAYSLNNNNHTSFASSYTFPYDGYVQIYAGGGSGTVFVYGSDATADADNHMTNANSADGTRSSVFVRKGMIAYATVTGTSNVSYIPFS